MNSIKSIYVPRMSTRWTEEAVMEKMARYGFGKVSNVDFTPINKKPGFGENVDLVVKSAFIHFEFINSIYTLWDTLENNGSYKFQVDTNEYWILLKNKNPIQRTLMNIHQVVENGRHLESLITEQANEIKNLKETIDELTEKIYGVHNIVYQLIGGLFCQANQKGIIKCHLKELGIGNYEDVTTEHDTHPFGIWPTTRQGDENSRRIENLEHFIEHHILPEAKTCCCDYKDIDDASSQEDEELLHRKHCAGCGNELSQADMEEYERQLEEKENRKFRNHRI